MSRVIDLNSDLGEGFGVWALGDDEALLRIVTSANVACGFHAGDPDILRRVCAQAAEQGVVIGAQVGYHDLAGFGRRAMDVEPGSLTNDVLYQIGALDGFARVAGTSVRYVKPHGALYNTVAHDTVQAAAVVEAIRLYDASLPLMGLPGSVLLTLANEAGLATVTEAFADRGYAPDGTLVPRSSRSDRIGIRLEGPALHHHESRRGQELVSEGVVRGSIQVPPGGQPVLFLADHPVTGGYPVVAVVRDADIDLAAQAVPGQALWIALATAPV